MQALGLQPLAREPHLLDLEGDAQLIERGDPCRGSCGRVDDRGGLDSGGRDRGGLERGGWDRVRRDRSGRSRSGSGREKESTMKTLFNRNMLIASLAAVAIVGLTGLTLDRGSAGGRPV